MRRFAFVSEAAAREYRALPPEIVDEFGKDLRRIQYDGDPVLSFKHLASSVGPGAMELIINGSPAYRCVYIAKYAQTAFVLHAFVKATNGVDRHAMAVALERLKVPKSELRVAGIEA